MRALSTTGRRLKQRIIDTLHSSFCSPGTIGQLKRAWTHGPIRRQFPQTRENVTTRISRSSDSMLQQGLSWRTILIEAPQYACPNDVYSWCTNFGGQACMSTRLHTIPWIATIRLLLWIILTWCLRAGT